MLYDVVQVDDEEPDRELCERGCSFNTYSYLGVAVLTLLKSKLDEGARGKIYLVDGEFPEEESKSAKFLAPEAIQAIRLVHPESRIFLLSGRESAEDDARRLNVGYLNKREFYPSTDLPKLLNAV